MGGGRDFVIALDTKIGKTKNHALAWFHVSNPDKPDSVLPKGSPVIYLFNLPARIKRTTLSAEAQPGLFGLSARKVYLSCRSRLRHWWALTPPSQPCLCPKVIGGLNLCSTFCHLLGCLLFQRVRCPALSGLSSALQQRRGGSLMDKSSIKKRAPQLRRPSITCNHNYMPVYCLIKRTDLVLSPTAKFSM